jgi:hypothetical protein
MSGEFLPSGRESNPHEAMPQRILRPETKGNE